MAQQEVLLMKPVDAKQRLEFAPLMAEIYGLESSHVSDESAVQRNTNSPYNTCLDLNTKHTGGTL